MEEISKAKVLEVFMKHYGVLVNRPDAERLVEADSRAIDELVPYKDGMTVEEVHVREQVIKALGEILSDDFGVKVATGVPLSGEKLEGAKAGHEAAKEILSKDRERVPLLYSDDEVTVEAWFKKLSDLAFDLVPKEKLDEQEWVGGFLSGFQGGIHQILSEEMPAGQSGDEQIA